MQCLLVHPDGRRERVVWDHREVAQRLGGAITFVGAVDHLWVVAVALQEPPPGLEVHAMSSESWIHEAEVRGPILFAGSDAEGEEMDVDVDSLVVWFEKK